jgi:hypothetical protein
MVFTLQGRGETLQRDAVRRYIRFVALICWLLLFYAIISLDSKAVDMSYCPHYPL